MYLTRLLVLASALIICTWARADIERVVSRSYPEGRVAKVSIESSSGSVDVETKTGGPVEVEVREILKVGDDREAAKLRENIKIDFEQSGESLEVVVKKTGAGGWFGWSDKVRFKIVARVPRATDMKVHTSGGHIKVGTLSGDAQLSTSGGGIETAVMDGIVDVKTSGGSINIGGAKGALHASTSGGSISVGQVFSLAELSTSGGGITVEAARGKLNASTSGGGIRATFVGPLTDGSELGTSGGSVHVKADADAGFDLDAKTSGGSVKVGFPVTMDNPESHPRRSEVVGKVGAGGPHLKLRTSGGSISVDPR